MGIFNGRNRESSVSCWIKFALVGVVIAIALRGANCDQEPTESQCRPYIEKALKEKNLDAGEKSDEETSPASGEVSAEQEENPPTDEITDSTESSKQEATDELKSEEGGEDDAESGEKDQDDGKPSGEAEESVETAGSEDAEDVQSAEDEKPKSGEGASEEEKEQESGEKAESKEETEETKSAEETETEKDEAESLETENESKEDDDVTKEQKDQGESQEETQEETQEESKEEADSGETQQEGEATSAQDETASLEDDKGSKEDESSKETVQDEDGVPSAENETKEDESPSEEQDKDKDDAPSAEEKDETESKEESQEEEKEKDDQKASQEEGDEKDSKEAETEEDNQGSKETVGDDDGPSEEAGQDSGETQESKETREKDVSAETEDKSAEQPPESKEAEEEDKDSKESKESVASAEETPSQETEKSQEDDEGDEESTPDEEDLTKEVVIPENLRERDHITKILRLDEDSVEAESVLTKAIDSTLKTLKNLYDNAIKPLEMLYKYRDLSNRHFGDPEIFSKPLVLFMGPWSGGKSSTINYLLDIEFSHMALRTGAEPSPAYFNILMHGKDEEILDGTQLAADWTFSGLQKFGQGLLDRLRGVKLNSRLLEKVNIVEIPGILEIRKQVQRLFPFNDACQWFIDRADIIFLVYDPAKLDVGPETEAILDQLKGREYQTRIILNKADQVKPEELMRVQGTLIWNISPLMSSTEPPIMYTTSLWSLPYEVGAPTRLLHAQERAFLRDLREAVDKRVENKIASARRFAVRVRNHAKMVDCYLTTYYNHKTFFGNRKKISDDIIENPQKYHIYEGLSTLTNISRYDLPDPEVYRDFFKINPLYDFTKLSDTCTYFRGCPINKLDVAIAYDLPELVGKYKKAVEAAKEQSQKTNS